jgi:hypothetical protein
MLSLMLFAVIAALMATRRAQEMARDFPHADILSLDNFPLCAHVPRPNIVFEVYDLYNGIAAPDATFDLVHIRHAMMHVSFRPLPKLDKP